MLTQTDLLGKLSKMGYQIAIICPDINDTTLKKYSLRYNIILIEYNFKNVWIEKYMYYRKYLLDDVKNNVSLYEKHKFKTRRFWNNKAEFIISKLMIIFNVIIVKFPVFKKIFRLFEKSIFNSGDLKNILSKYDIKNIVSTYPVSPFEAKILNTSKKLGINTITHLLSWDNITCKGIFPVLSDYFIVWGEIMQNELIQYYNISKNKIFICGVPHFDLHSEKDFQANQFYLNNLGLDFNLPYIFFGMSSSRFSPNEIGIIKYLAKNINSDKYHKKIQLIIRPHPQNVQIGTGMEDPDWIDQLRSLKSSKVSIDFPDLVKSKLPWSMDKKDMRRLSNIISFAAISLNSCSTITVDSVMCNTFPILTPFDGEKNYPYWQSAERMIDYPHLSKLVSFNEVKIAKSFIELDNHINCFLKNDCYEYDAKTTKKLYCFKNDGNSTERVLKTLEENFI
tara:strand:- start:231 stop:1580 length:1350 start_codon:yes stop_codon:yes gene_type:complete